MNTAYADTFTNKDFLEMPEAHQKFWIQGVMHVLAGVAAQKDKAQGKCIGNWYFGDKQAERNGLILASMKKYSDYDPSTVFIFLVQRQCGKL